MRKRKMMKRAKKNKLTDHKPKTTTNIMKSLPFQLKNKKSKYKKPKDQTDKSLQLEVVKAQFSKNKAVQ